MNGKTELLKPLGGHFMVPGVAQFRAVDWFKDGKMDSDVLIASMNENFREHFLGKVEKNVPEAQIAVHEITANSHDPAILDVLGGWAEIQLTHMHELMRRKQAGEETSLKDGANIFYVRDERGPLWPVGAYWDPRGRVWSVYAFLMPNPFPWLCGTRVTSRVSRVSG